MLRALMLAVALTVGAPGCAILKPQPVAALKMPSNLSEAGKEAQKLIVEANVALTAAYNVIAANVADDTMDPNVAAAYLAKLDSYAKDVDVAQVMLDSGDIGDATTQAALLNKLVTALHKQVVEHAKGK